MSSHEKFEFTDCNEKRESKQTCLQCGDVFIDYQSRDYCCADCYYSSYEENDAVVTLKTVGGYEVLTDGTDSVKVHQLQACLDNDPHDVFNTRYMNVHHRNTIPWDNRIENILLLRANCHYRLHNNIDWNDLVSFFDTNDVADTELQISERIYRLLTEAYLNGYPLDHNRLID